VSSYVEARDVAAALAAMADGARPVAGGTDLVVGARQGKAALPSALVGIHRIAGLDAIEVQADGSIRIGALVSHAAILADRQLGERIPGLLDACAIVGSHATRATGTLGGNVMNSSPAMDTGAPLLCAGARAVLASPEGTRVLDLDALWLGPGKSSATPEELLVAIELPPAPDGPVGSAYVRLQYRRQMEIAVVGAGVQVELSADGRTVTDARVAITALAPVIHRVAEAEAALVSAPARGAGLHDAARLSGQRAGAASRPISDVRGSADYRRAMAAVLTRRAVLSAVARARGEQVPIPASDSTTGS
jgi:CO/xanthine dehydrogenase FAD-binding subunit